MNKFAVLTLSFILSAINLIYAANPDKSSQIRQALTRMRQNYPEAQYVDVYKFFMQDYFGPGHILSDTTAAGKYIRSELKSTTRFDGEDFEPSGYKGNFYRVNLSLLKEGRIDYHIFFSAFTRSVSGIVPPTPDEWRKEWAEIDAEIYNLGYTYPDEEADRTMIRQLLDEGNFVAHHSERFNKAYSLHYRIISAELLKKEIIPAIKP